MVFNAHGNQMFFANLVSSSKIQTKLPALLICTAALGTTMAVVLLVMSLPLLIYFKPTRLEIGVMILL